MGQPALGVLLGQLRERAGFSLRQLADAADVDHAYIYRLESGDKESPSAAVLAKLVRALKVDQREAEMLEYVSVHPETDPGLVAHVLADATVNLGEFTALAATVFRGTGRGDYASQIKLIRRIMAEQNDRR